MVTLQSIMHSTTNKLFATIKIKKNWKFQFNIQTVGALIKRKKKSNNNKFKYYIH